MAISPSPTPIQPGAITALVPYAHVADVERSLAFYALMGFTRRTAHAAPSGRTIWADAVSGDARLMLAQASGPIPADQQAVLFYMYCNDVAALRTRLLKHGVRDGGQFNGKASTSPDRTMVFNLAFPFYMPAGELRVHDPDGYVILVGQLA